MLDEWADYARKMHEFQRGVVEHVEMLAAAYMKATDIPPEECELVVETLPGKMVYSFRRRLTQRALDGAVGLPVGECSECGRVHTIGLCPNSPRK